MRAAARQRAAGGYLILDVTIGLAILAIMLGMLVSTLGQQRRASRHLADTRAAVRLAERTLASWQTGAALTPTRPTEGLSRWRLLDDPAPVDTHRWVEVTAEVRGRTARLVGLVPAEAFTDETRTGIAAPEGAVP